jgi:hypothetical protein
VEIGQEGCSGQRDRNVRGHGLTRFRQLPDAEASAPLKGIETDRWGVSDFYDKEQAVN